MLSPSHRHPLSRPEDPVARLVTVASCPPPGATPRLGTRNAYSRVGPSGPRRNLQNGVDGTPTGVQLLQLCQVIGLRGSRKKGSTMRVLCLTLAVASMTAMEAATMQAGETAVQDTASVSEACPESCLLGVLQQGRGQGARDGSGPGYGRGNGGGRDGAGQGQGQGRGQGPRDGSGQRRGQGYGGGRNGNCR